MLLGAPYSLYAVHYLLLFACSCPLIKVATPRLLLPAAYHCSSRQSLFPAYFYRWPFVAHYRLYTACFLLLTVCYSLIPFCCLLSSTGCLLLAFCFLLFAAAWLSFLVARRSPFTAHYTLSACASYSQPTNHGSLFASGYCFSSRGSLHAAREFLLDTRFVLFVSRHFPLQIRSLHAARIFIYIARFLLVTAR